MSSIGSDNFGQIYSDTLAKLKKGESITNQDVSKLSEAALKDGVVTKEEKTALFDIATNSKNTVDLTKIKMADGTPLADDVTKAFETGFKAKSEASQKSKEFVESERNSNSAGGIASFVQDLEKYVPNTIKNMIPLETRNTIENTFEDWKIPDHIEEKIKTQAADLEKGFISEVSKKVSSDYTKFAADSVNCVHDALKTIDSGFNVAKGAVSLSQSVLNEMTGVNWDAVNVSRNNTEQLKKILTPDKTLITDGGHAYVFKGIDPQSGNLKVLDPTVNKETTISKLNSTVTAYVQGAGDGDKTGKAKADGNVKSFKDVDSLKKVNSQDFDAQGKETESWQIRKLFVMMADPTQKDSMKALSSGIKEAEKSGDISKVKQLLEQKGIKLDDREIKAMVSIFTAPISEHGELNKNMPKSNNMLEAFEWLNKSASGTLTVSQTNYLKSVQYSNVDLTNFFSGTDSLSGKANSMFEVMKKMLAGGSGC